VENGGDSDASAKASSVTKLSREKMLPPQQPTRARHAERIRRIRVASTRGAQEGSGVTGVTGGLSRVSLLVGALFAGHTTYVSFQLFAELFLVFRCQNDCHPRVSVAPAEYTGARGGGAVEVPWDAEAAGARGGNFAGA